ncbi:hypothetical protein PIB30_032765 [Stylosanthes scabra]|uniref:FBD domain-containing protein n=1 Tax=Stylosanthes scabra TaxID=79078 RepID=A0ABU6UE39_9FABA|nr:hypothetical protein [Stylosanthes scabra]
MSGVDRISALSDAILVHILSFLPPKTVVTATSTLSRRWRDLWRSVPTVDLDDTAFRGKPDRFLPFAYALMLSRDVTKSILNFRLKCEISSIASSDISLWLKIAIEKKLETLELSYGFYSPMKLPAEILTCSSLVVLKLNNFIVDRTSRVHLPFLKTLHMDRIKFVKGEYLEMILSGCPNIHHLRIKGSELHSSFIPLALTFTDLIHVELLVSQCNWFSIVGLLNSCPLLQVLDVGGYYRSSRPLVVSDHPYSKIAPACLSSHLRACTLRNFHGDDVDIQFATSILQNTRVLNIMSIYCPESSSEGVKLQILKKISMVPRISPTCKVCCSHKHSLQEVEESLALSSRRDLDDSRFSGNGDLFVRFVYAVMLSRDLTQPILKFRLKCHNSSYAQCDVNTWVNAAILRRVETFELSLFPAMNNSAMKLPTGILTCSTLVVLKLTKVRVGHSFIVQLPARKTLYMHGVEFARNENLENFLSGCPNLNHLLELSAV